MGMTCLTLLITCWAISSKVSIEMGFSKGFMVVQECIFMILGVFLLFGLVWN